MDKVIRDANAAVIADANAAAANAADAAAAIADANAAAAAASAEGQNKGTFASSTDAAKATMCADLVSLVDTCALIASASLLQHTASLQKMARAHLDVMLPAFETWLPRCPPPRLRQSRPLRARRLRTTPTP